MNRLKDELGWGLSCDACAGGNQRDLAREKNKKKQEALAKGKTKESGTTLQARKERCVVSVLA